MRQKPEKANLNKYDNILEYITIKLNTMDIKNNYFYSLLSEKTKCLQIQFFRNCTPGRRAVFDLRTNMKHRRVSEILNRMSTETQDNIDNKD